MVLPVATCIWWLRVQDVVVGIPGNPHLQVEWAGHGLPCSAQGVCSTHRAATSRPLAGSSLRVSLRGCGLPCETRTKPSSCRLIPASCHGQKQNILGVKKWKNNLRLLRNTKENSIYNKQHCLLKPLFHPPISLSLYLLISLSLSLSIRHGCCPLSLSWDSPRLPP